jgi:hypothetical protein
LTVVHIFETFKTDQTFLALIRDANGEVREDPCLSFTHICISLQPRRGIQVVGKSIWGDIFAHGRNNPCLVSFSSHGRTESLTLCFVHHTRTEIEVEFFFALLEVLPWHCDCSSAGDTRVVVPFPGCWEVLVQVVAIETPGIGCGVLIEIFFSRSPRDL